MFKKEEQIKSVYESRISYTHKTFLLHNSDESIITSLLVAEKKNPTGTLGSVSLVAYQ